MKLRNSRTEEVLKKAFARELDARARYLFYAGTARQHGLRQVADVFEATANNEAEHAGYEFTYLGGAPDTVANLEQSILREFEEANKLYPQAADIAREEGFAEIAEFFNRMAGVEEKHGNNMQALLDSIKKDEKIKGKTVGHSAVQMAQMMMPSHANPIGVVHGGELMKLMDDAAAVVALRHSQNLVATAEVEDIKFKSPVHVGELVFVNARITFTSRSTMRVQITAEAENPLTGDRRPAFDASYIFVAIDAGGKTVEVPSLIISTEEEEKLFAAGLAKYNARKQR